MPYYFSPKICPICYFSTVFSRCAAQRTSVQTGSVQNKRFKRRYGIAPACIVLPPRERFKHWYGLPPACIVLLVWHSARSQRTARTPEPPNCITNISLSSVLKRRYGIAQARSVLLKLLSRKLESRNLLSHVANKLNLPLACVLSFDILSS